MDLTLAESLDKDKKGQFSYAIYFIVVMVIFLPILLFGFPVLQTMAIGFASNTDNFNEKSESFLPDIENADLRADYNSMIQAQYDASETNVSILSDAIKFGAIFLVVIVFVGIYLLARRNVETGSIG